MFQGTAAEVIGDIRRYQALGVSHFVFDPTVPELRAVLKKHGALRERRATEARPTEVTTVSISHHEACALIESRPEALDDLLARAGEVRDRGPAAP